MSDEAKPPRKPPRFLRPDDPDVVRVDEDPPVTERVPLPMPPSRLLPDKAPVRFDVHKGRQPSYVELAASLLTVQETLAKVVSMQSDILGTQRKLALQSDHLGVIVNSRFDVFHEELSLLRAVVTGDHAPRIAAVEKTAGQKAKLAAIVGGKYTGLAIGGAFLLRALGKAYPEFGAAIEGVLAVFGL